MTDFQRQMRRGEGPPADGTLSLKLAIPPVSQQANSVTKCQFIEDVRNRLKKYEFVLSGDVKIEVEWGTSEQERYESDRSPDVDNILKPLIDAISGSRGILFDDNQVHSVACSWVQSTTNHESLSIDIHFSPDEWLPGKEFIFVQFDSGLCYPIPMCLERAVQFEFVVVLKQLLELRGELDAAGLGYGWAKLVMPALRVFHRSRIRGFKVVRVTDFESESVSNTTLNGTGLRFAPSSTLAIR